MESCVTQSATGKSLGTWYSEIPDQIEAFKSALNGLKVDDLTIFDPTMTPTVLDDILNSIDKGSTSAIHIECGQLASFEGTLLPGYTNLDRLQISYSNLTVDDFRAIVENLSDTPISNLNLGRNEFDKGDSYVDLSLFDFSGVVDTLTSLRFTPYFSCEGPWIDDYRDAGIWLDGTNWVIRTSDLNPPPPHTMAVDPTPTVVIDDCVESVEPEVAEQQVEEEVTEPNWPPATIMNIEPAVSAIRVWTGREVVLTTEVYGVQGILDNDLADAVSPNKVWFDWIDESRNADFAEFTNRPMRINDVADDREVIYQVPTIPGNYTVSVNVPFAAHCKGPRAEMDETMEEAIARCTAEFELIVRYQRNSDDEVAAPVNPDGPIPASVVNDRGEDCPVFTPEEGGLLDAVDHSVSVEAGAVQNNTAVAICVNKAGTASKVGFTQHRYTLHGDLYSVTAFDLNGRELSEYEFNFPIEACIPLPDALRTRISDVELAVVERDRSLTVLQSNTAFTHGGIRTCGSLGELPAMIAVGAKGAPSALLEPEEELPDTGPGAPSLPTPIFGILAGLVAMSLSLAAVRFGRQRENRRS